MPGRTILDFLELDTEKVLVDVENDGDDHRDREVLLDKHVIEIKSLLDVLPVVVTVVPKIEFAIKVESLLLMFLFFELEKDVALLLSNRPELSLEVIEELSVRLVPIRGAYLDISHSLNIVTGLDHLLLGDIIRPSFVSQQRSDLATEIKGLVEERDIYFQALFITLLSKLARGRVLREFELRAPDKR